MRLAGSLYTHLLSDSVLAPVFHKNHQKNVKPFATFFLFPEKTDLDVRTIDGSDRLPHPDL